MLVALSFALAAIANLVSPVGIQWQENWSHSVDIQAEQLGIATVVVASAREMLDSHEYILFDARTSADYEAGHLPGALSWPASEIEAKADLYLPILRIGQPVLVYCSGRACDESLHLATYLKAQGLQRVSLFTGGFADWKGGGYPIETGQ